MAGTFQIIIAPAAQQDLEDIIKYLAEKESYDRAGTRSGRAVRSDDS